MSREADWIRSAAAGELPSIDDHRRRALGALDGEEVARIAYAHQVGPWLVAAICDGVSTPPGAVAELRAVAMRQAGITMAHRAELAWLLALLRERGIEALVLKGPVLASTVYPDEGLRPYRDVDLLLHREDIPAVAAALEERGLIERYSETLRHQHAEHPTSQHIYDDPARAIRVELHSEHLQMGVHPVDMDAIWERSEPIQIDGAPARTLEAHDLFVHLCVHLHRHSFSRLIWLKDLDLIVRAGGLDWEIIRARANAQGCTDSVALSLELIEAALGTPLPDEARAIAAVRPAWSRLLQRLVWRPGRILDLRPERRWRLRRLVQFAPESGLVRGGLPSLLFTGRRRAKLRVLGGALVRRLPGQR